MAAINVDINPCINAAFGGSPPPIGTKIRIKVGATTYNYWATKTGANTWSTSTTALKGAVTVDIGACLPAIGTFDPANDWFVISGVDYFYDTTDSKFKCGRPPGH